MRNPIVGWHDPNFGVRFDDYMDAIEAAVPPGRMRHIAESSLSLLSEPHLQRLRRNGFQALLPGIESWFALGNKSKTRHTGMDKVRQCAEHVNLLLRYVPYVQTNFVLGLDSDEGPEPFELTKKFIDLAPGAFPAYSLLSAFGRAAPMNLDYQRAGRVLPFPFTFLNNNHAMNVRPVNYSWAEFYDRLVDLTSYSFSWRAIRPAAGRHPGADPPLDERGARDVVGGLGADRVSHHDSGAARHRPERARLHGGGGRPAAGLLRGADPAGPGRPAPAPAGGRPHARPQRVPEERGARARHLPAGRTSRARRGGGHGPDPRGSQLTRR